MGWDGVFAAVDVHYLGTDRVRAALLLADNPEFSSVIGERTMVCTGVEPYRPGEFYRRELPHLRAVCAGAGPFAVLLVDGYVDLDEVGRPGLGAYAHQELGVPVVGVARNRFRTATHAIEVMRGQSRRPLYVTAAGCPLSDAARMVCDMAGPFRLPTALRRVDRLSRGIELPSIGMHATLKTAPLVEGFIEGSSP